MSYRINSIHVCILFILYDMQTAEIKMKDAHYINLRHLIQCSEPNYIYYLKNKSYEETDVTMIVDPDL